MIRLAGLTADNCGGMVVLTKVIERRWIGRWFRQLSVSIHRLTSISTMSCMEGKRRCWVHLKKAFFSFLQSITRCLFEWRPSNSKAGFVGVMDRIVNSRFLQRVAWFRWSRGKRRDGLLLTCLAQLRRVSPAVIARTLRILRTPVLLSNSSCQNKLRNNRIDI